MQETFWQAKFVVVYHKKCTNNSVTTNAVIYYFPLSATFRNNVNPLTPAQTLRVSTVLYTMNVNQNIQMSHGSTIQHHLTL